MTPAPPPEDSKSEPSQGSTVTIFAPQVSKKESRTDRKTRIQGEQILSSFRRRLFRAGALASGLSAGPLGAQTSKTRRILLKIAG